MEGSILRRRAYWVEGGVYLCPQSSSTDYHYNPKVQIPPRTLPPETPRSKNQADSSKEMLASSRSVAVIAQLLRRLRKFEKRDGYNRSSYVGEIKQVIRFTTICNVVPVIRAIRGSAVSHMDVGIHGCQVFYDRVASSP